MLKPLILSRASPSLPFLSYSSGRELLSLSDCSFRVSAFQSSPMAERVISSSKPAAKIIDSHLHVWASPDEAVDYPYSHAQVPTLPGHSDLLLERMEEANVDGALIVQPINHMFDHRYVTSVLKKHPSKFVGCCLGNPAEDGTGIRQLEELVLKDGYRAVRFNPYLWPSGQKMTNQIGKAMFCKAGELGISVGFMCMKGLHLHIADIEIFCSEFPSTTVLLDHLAFCKPPINDQEKQNFEDLLNLSRFPQVYIKLSALFRVSREPYPYYDITQTLSQIVTRFGADHVMWGSDFPFIETECGYKKAKDAVVEIASKLHLTSSEVEWIMGKTALQLFSGNWSS